MENQPEIPKIEDLPSDAAGRREALFVPLFTSSERRLRSFVFGMVPSQQDVDEIMQEVSIVLWKKFDQYEPGTEFIRWAYVVARYEVLLYRRKKARDRLCFSEKMLELLGEEYEDDEDVLERERTALDRCLKKLPESDRETLITIYSKDMKINELAEATGRTATSLYKRLNRMRAKLLTCVESQLKTV
ncbi:RNA polymerase sigma-70 factor [Haloferula helveola]|uniref:RNA polymerase sigma-70 factor n=1 Tax=Haloferula helveola TaxID=490095 RepID=A0ABM7R9M7_9BACT|nr:RNA polymerase sigma-70 factor [Haloferula helveola]